MSEIGLESAEFFRVLSPDQLSRVRPLVSEKRLKRREVLFFAGQLASHLWVVRRGEVRLYKSSANGRLATLEVLRPGEAFGALLALSEGEYPASAEATVDGVAWCLPRSCLVSLLDSEPRVAVEILHIVSHRLRHAHERLRSFAHDPAPARLARALVHTVHRGEAKVTRRALAEIAGTSVETAIRVLRRFEQSGIIKGDVGRVEVLDELELRRVFEDLEA